MAAGAASLTCKAKPLARGELQEASVLRAGRQSVRSLPVCKQCSAEVLRGSLQRKRILVQGRRADCVAANLDGGVARETATVQKNEFGKSLHESRGLRRWQSLRVRAEEPSNAEREVQVKETLLRDALEEKSKKGAESKPESGFKVENRQQVTAIVTGIISVLLAFGYLSLLSFDTRGVNLLPPPPEALGE